MPSPVGHALAGIATGCVVLGRRRAEGGRDDPVEGRIETLRQRWMSPEVLAFGLLGILPDVDLLFGVHSTYTHSVGAAAIISIVAGIIAARRTRASGMRLAVAAALAYGSHVLLDWLGTDDTAPFGVTALWPFSDDFFLSDRGWFLSVCREYWEVSCWLHNTQGVLWEVIVFAPLAIGASYLACTDYRR